MSENQDWKLQLKLSVVEPTRAQLSFNRAQASATSNHQFAAQHRGALAAFVAEFRTSEKWQRFERIRTKLQVAQSDLATARGHEQESQEQYRAFVASEGQFDDSELIATVSQFRNAAARHAAEVDELQQALVEAYDDCASELGRLLVEQQTKGVADLKQAVLDVQAELEATITPLVDRFATAQGRWHAAMKILQDPHAKPVESALGPRPTFPADASAAGPVQVTNPMRPEPKTAGNQSLAEPAYAK